MSQRAQVATATGADPDPGAGIAWMEGEYLPIAEARLPILDWGFTRSDVTYDVVHVWKGSFFRLEDHLDRFERSCRSLRLHPPVDRVRMREIVTACVRRSGLREAYVEMLSTRGQPRPGSRDPRDCSNTFMAFAIPFVWVIKPEVQARGAHLHICGIPRIPPECVDPRVKNFHWGDLTRALFEAFERNADTAVLVDMQGRISEGPGFNVFCIRDGAVLTPGGTCLEGITRESVRELCEEAGVPFRVTSITPDELREADEVFLATTAGGVMPVSRVDDRILGNGRPGPLSTRLRERYWERHEEGWHATPIDYG